MSFMERVTDLLSEKKLDQKELALYIGVTTSRISDWKAERVKSYTKYAEKIADFLDTSVDYLYGKTNIRTKKNPVSEDTGIEIETLSDDDLAKLMLQKFRTIKSPELQRQALDYLAYLESKDAGDK